MSRRGTASKQPNERKKVEALMLGAGLCWRCSLCIQHGDGASALTLTELLSVAANELAAVYEKHICTQQRGERGGNVIKGLSLN